MFDIGWQELFLIGVVTLVVVGPKDLPKVLRTGARYLQKARAMSREFQNGLAEMAREAELDDIKERIEHAARYDLGEELRNAADPTGKLSSDFDPAEYNRRIKEAMEGGSRATGPRHSADDPSPPPPDDAMPPLPDPAGNSGIADGEAEAKEATAADAPPPPAATRSWADDRPLRP
ncbi:MAG: twin-arginine translocase subunit TatB [Rhodospirillales bacterium]|nr:twin-arginine translocase subunit TatB [Rhodospirillales bacterium]